MSENVSLGYWSNYKDCESISTMNKLHCTVIELNIICEMFTLHIMLLITDQSVYNAANAKPIQW